MNAVSRKIREKIRNNLPGVVITLITFVIIFLLLFNRIVIFIGSGEAGVLYRLFLGGTVTTKVYPEGIRCIWPWDTMYIYNVRVQEVPHEFDVLTRNGLKVLLNISIRYYPQYKMVGLLHKKVGPDYVNVVVVPEIENVLRVLIGRLDAEDVYTTKQAIIEKSISEAIEQIAQRYVKVDDVIIKKILLPDSVEESIRAKIEQKHKADAYQFRIVKEEQEKVRKRIEAEGLERFRRALSPEVLHWLGIQATLKLAESENSKTLIFSSGKDGLPIMGGVSLPIPPFPELYGASEPAVTKSAGNAENSEPEPAVGAEPSETPAIEPTEENPG